MEIIKVEQNKDYGLVVSSRAIAKGLEKRHSDVLESIENIISNSRTEISALFIKSKYLAKNGKKNPKYLLTKDGFILYMFNIQGHNDFKMAYINEFNRMEKLLKEKEIKATPTTNPNVLTFRGVPVITLREFSELVEVHRTALYKRITKDTIISGEELVEFKTENNLTKITAYSCIAILNEEKALEIVGKLRNKNKKELKEKVIAYFTPNMNTIKDTLHWERIKQMQRVVQKAGLDLFQEMKKVDEAIENLHNIKKNLIGAMSIMNSDLKLLEN